jgi:hypothetical protein
MFYDGVLLFFDLRLYVGHYKMAGTFYFHYLIKKSINYLFANSYKKNNSSKLSLSISL